MTKTMVIDRDKVEEVTALRNEGKKWNEIAEISGLPVGKAMLVFGSGKVPKNERIKDATPADVKRLRDEQSLSWGDIMVRVLLPEGAVRRMYREAGGEDKGHRIGKGGRHPVSNDGTPREPKAKAEKVVKPPKAPAVDVFADMDEEAVRTKITGFALKVDLGNGETEVIAVKEVKRFAKGKLVVVDGKTGASRTLKAAAVIDVSKKKVSITA